MAQAPEEITKDIVVAWLSHNSFSFRDAAETGEALSTIYKAVLRGVREGDIAAAGISPEVETETAPPRRRGGRR